MRKRKRYDTVELVMELKRERRHALLLTLAGLAILGVLVVVYFTSTGDEEIATVPTAKSAHVEDAAQAGTDGKSPKEAAAGATVKETAAVAAPEGAAAETAGTQADAAAKPAEAAPEQAVVHVGSARRARVWIDGKPVKLKHPVDLSPGKHEVRARLGRKTVTEAVTLDAGQSYDLRLDGRHKRVQLKKR